MKTKRIILFGGTFDPIHLGHIEVARASQIKLQAQEVIFIPANRSPHKHTDAVASPKDRLNMIACSIKNDSEFTVSSFEINRPQPSYTLDTVKHFRSEYADDVELCFLIGADTICDLHKWYKIDELMNLCRLCTMYRGGLGRPNFSVLHGIFSDEIISQLEYDVIQTPLLDISSTNIRQSLADGNDVNMFLAPEVMSYIKEHKLYTSAPN